MRGARTDSGRRVAASPPRARPRRRPCGLAFLLATPLVDLALLAAVYIGVSVGWGQRIVDWADARFAYHFTGGPKPRRYPRTGALHAARERQEWLRHLLAWATGTGFLALGVLVVGDLDRTTALLNVAALWTLVLAIDFAISFSYTIWPRERRET